MTPSLEGSPTKAKEAPSPHEVRLAPLDTNPIFQCLGGTFGDCFCLNPNKLKRVKTLFFFQWNYKACCTWVFKEFYHFNFEIFLWIDVILLVFKMFRDIPDGNDRLKKEASWLDIFIFKDLITLLGILFGPQGLF